MEVVTKTEKSIGEQIYSLLETDPENYDVSFCVGQEKTIVKGVRIILKAASPVFYRQFQDKWENAVVKGEEGIPLPDLDPSAFQLFIKLLIQDQWSVESLKFLNMSLDSLLSVLGICRLFEITKAVEGLEKAASELISTLDRYITTPDFMNMSRANLETLLSYEDIPMDELELYECLCKWAEYQCSKIRLEVTGENIRKVLGGCLSKIRFPTLTFLQFSSISRNSLSILTGEERLAIYDFIGSGGKEQDNFDVTKLDFKTKRRIPRNRILNLAQVYSNSIIGLGEYLCKGGCTFYTTFQSSLKIALLGISFFGPISGDADYDVIVRIRVVQNGQWSEIDETTAQKLRGRKDQVMYLWFDEPITIEPSNDSSWGSYCHINYGLRGSLPVSMLKGHSEEKVFTFQGSVFRLRDFDGNDAISEIIFKQL